MFEIMDSDDEIVISDTSSLDDTSVIYDSSYELSPESISKNKLSKSPVTLPKKSCKSLNDNNSILKFLVPNKLTNLRNQNMSSSETDIAVNSISDSESETSIVLDSPDQKLSRTDRSLLQTSFENKSCSKNINLLDNKENKKTFSYTPSNEDDKFSECTVLDVKNSKSKQFDFKENTFDTSWKLKNLKKKPENRLSNISSSSGTSYATDIPLSTLGINIKYKLSKEKDEAIDLTISSDEEVNYKKVLKGLTISSDEEVNYKKVPQSSIISSDEEVNYKKVPQSSTISSDEEVNYEKALQSSSNDEILNDYKFKFECESSSSRFLSEQEEVLECTTVSDFVNHYKKASSLDLTSLNEALFGNSQPKTKKKINNYGGKLSEHNEQRMIRLTSDAVESIHKTLKSMPDVDVDYEEDPQGLKVELLLHQKKALAWLIWRESQIPQGGILADDMGLGKTLTMIALKLRQDELENDENVDPSTSDLELKYVDDRNTFFTKKEKDGKKKMLRSKGTLVVCPASLLGQWENEVKRHVIKKKLTFFIYHGNNREISLSRLSQYDFVATTYQQVMREGFSNTKAKQSSVESSFMMEDKSSREGPLFRIFWSRIVLDEAHQIRNHQSKTSQSVCMLQGQRRWAISGTPVQNKDMDFFSLVRFLRVSPFGDYTCWKHEIKTNTPQGLRKLNLLVRGLVLRRTKNQVDQTTGEKIVNLPPKEVVVHKVNLSQDEREVYDQVFAFSRKSLIQYMKSQEDKENEMAGNVFKQVVYQDDTYTPTLEVGIFKDNEVKVHHMLVLLLRLRQICGHPGLIYSILEDDKEIEPELMKDDPFDLSQCLDKLNIDDSEEQTKEIDTKVKKKILCTSNPVFEKRNQSSKISKIIDEIMIIKEKGELEKAVIVSQWTSMLIIISEHLKNIGTKVASISGQIPVKDRSSIVEEFNAHGKGPMVLLLSLGAGGVGLNLTGANHLFLCDMHWNPQLEAQACDRIYRVGQKRPVKIHKFVILNTVEEKILELQEKKLELANMVLTGTKMTQSNKLTLQDLKALFSIV